MLSYQRSKRCCLIAPCTAHILQAQQHNPLRDSRSRVESRVHRSRDLIICVSRYDSFPHCDHILVAAYSAAQYMRSKLTMNMYKHMHFLSSSSSCLSLGTKCDCTCLETTIDDEEEESLRAIMRGV